MGTRVRAHILAGVGHKTMNLQRVLIARPIFVFQRKVCCVKGKYNKYEKTILLAASFCPLDLTKQRN